MPTFYKTRTWTWDSGLGGWYLYHYDVAEYGYGNAPASTSIGHWSPDGGFQGSGCLVAKGVSHAGDGSLLTWCFPGTWSSVFGIPKHAQVTKVRASLRKRVVVDRSDPQHGNYFGNVLTEVGLARAIAIGPRGTPSKSVWNGERMVEGEWSSINTDWLDVADSAGLEAYVFLNFCNDGGHTSYFEARVDDLSLEIEYTCDHANKCDFSTNSILSRGNLKRCTKGWTWFPRHGTDGWNYQMRIPLRHFYPFADVVQGVGSPDPNCVRLTTGGAWLRGYFAHNSVEIADTRRWRDIFGIPSDSVIVAIRLVEIRTKVVGSPDLIESRSGFGDVLGRKAFYIENRLDPVVLWEGRIATGSEQDWSTHLGDGTWLDIPYPKEEWVTRTAAEWPIFTIRAHSVHRQIMDHLVDTVIVEILYEEVTPTPPPPPVDLTFYTGTGLVKLETFSRAFTTNSLLSLRSSLYFFTSVEKHGKVTRTSNFRTDSFKAFSREFVGLVTASVLHKSDLEIDFIADCFLALDNNFTTSSFLRETHVFSRIFVADSVLSKHDISIGFATSSFLRFIRTEVFVTDSFLAGRPQSVSFLFSAAISGEATKEVTTDAYVLHINVQAFSSDSLLVYKRLCAYSTNSVLKIEISKTCITDSYIFSRVVKEFTSDSLLRKTISPRLSTDADLFGSRTKLFYSSSALSRYLPPRLYDLLPTIVKIRDAEASGKHGDPILKQIIDSIDDQSSNTQNLITGLKHLLDVATAGPAYLSLINALLGSGYSDGLIEHLKKLFVSDAISFHKIRGTKFSVNKKLSYKTSGKYVVSELYKSSIEDERGDYSLVRDSQHLYRAARVAIFKVGE